MHRQILENPLASKPNYLAIWIYLLLKANHEDKEIIWNNKKTLIKKGSFITSKQSIAKHFALSVGTVSYILQYFKVEQMIEQSSNHRFTVISIRNYSQFQSVEQSVENKLKTNKTQVETNNNDKNDKNILVNNKLLTNTSKKDEDVDYILQVFEETIGHKPTDRSPRNMAYTLKKQIQRLIKDLSPYVSMEFKDTVNKSFAWYDNQNELKARSLNTVRRNIVNVLFENTRKKYIGKVVTS